ncbi:MAG TPA: PepSY-associated TM helix domain-containing protein [Chitinophagaceae bacterium]|nr:PepSY-associated TM helix domain-containing protein [Chitinophagaceae bacterium]
MKKWIRRIHLYLGLSAGLVIMVSCFTGAVLVFEEELQHAFNRDRYDVKIEEKRLPIETLIGNLKEIEPKAAVTRVQVFTDPARSVVISYNGGKKSQAFINPYTGQVIELYKYQDTFFYTMFALHRWLLGGDVGKLIVGICTLVFVFILITGIILWWPKTRRILLQRLKIKSDAGGKRLTHDLHIVLGFYSAIFLFIFAFTGLAWSFEWFNKGIYKITNSPVKGPKPPQSTFHQGNKMIDLELALTESKQQMPEVVFYNINIPKDSTEAITVTSLSHSAAHSSATDAIYLDQYTGKKIGQLYFDQRSRGAQVRATFKPVHTGSIWGLPSKTIALVVCLLGTSFPITGTLIWINRTRKKKSVIQKEDKISEAIVHRA